MIQEPIGEMGLRGFCIAIVGWLLSASLVLAQAGLPEMPPLAERITPQVLKTLFPSADRFEVLQDKGPASAAVYAGKDLLGYAFSTYDVLRAPGYSSTPFDAIGGVSTDGHVTGGVLLFHREPYLMNDDRRTGLMVQFLGKLNGLEAKLGAVGGLEPGFVAGATISARAMRNGILEGAQIVLRYRTGAKLITEPTVDMLNFKLRSVANLIADQSLVRVRVTNEDLAKAQERAGLAGVALDVAPRGDAKALYLDLTLGYAMPPTIGRNTAGQGGYHRMMESLPEGAQALIFGSQSNYDHLGTKYNNLSNGFHLERMAVVQGGKTFEFKKSDVVSVDFLLGWVSNALVLQKDRGFDPLKPWRTDIFAYARHPDGKLERFLLTSVDYQLPPQYILLPEAPTGPAWMEAWVEGRTQIIILGVMLAVLTAILALQHTLTRYRQAHRWIRNGFLLFTLVWLGWTASAQLSIVHVINYLKGPVQGLSLGFYLAEPLIVILSIYTAISLILLGRGVFCGWLCPFGALQELLANVSRALGLPQWNPPESAQKYLWNLKYVSLVVVVGLAFLAPDLGAAAAEVEPFKTAITAMFARGLPYVIYAVILLLIGLFTERAYCRFLCPLGASLAVLDRLHLIDLLKRRPECGNPCHLCEHSCPVRAIERSGKIKMAECFQCLDCQVEYYDDHRCPPLAKVRKQLDRATRPPLASGVPVRPVTARTNLGGVNP